MWYKPEKAIAEWMDKNGVHHIWREIPGAHVWPVWHTFLAETAPLLFTAKGK